MVEFLVSHRADVQSGELMNKQSAQTISSSVSHESVLPRTTCTLAHDLNNKIAIILTHCELVIVQSALDSKASRHLHVIREAAKCIADMVGNHQCSSDEA
jgi:hypothetical protein